MKNITKFIDRLIISQFYAGVFIFKIGFALLIAVYIIMVITS